MRVLGKTRATLAAAAALIIATAALCVLSTLIGWVFDRRRDFAIMKALGASEGLISGFFAAEAAALGAVGAIVGFGIGVGVAAWIGQSKLSCAGGAALQRLARGLRGQHRCSSGFRRASDFSAAARPTRYDLERGVR